MKKITKFVTLLLALAMVFSLAACSSGKGKDKADGSADEASKLYQQLMQKENDILAANSELWNKVFLSANKNSTMIEDGTNYGDFLLATIESAKDSFSADELKTLKAGAEQIKEIEGKLDGDKTAIAEAKDILAKKGVTYSNLWFASDSEAGKFTAGLYSFPTTYVVDKNGNIVGQPIVGGITAPDQAKKLNELIDQALASSK